MLIYDLEEMMPKTESFLDIVNKNRMAAYYAEAQKKQKEIPTYTAKRGDSMWAIATANGLTLDELIKMNPQIKNNTIYPGTTLNLDYQYDTNLVDLKKEAIAEANWNKDNMSAIQNVHHDSNYVVVDKKNRILNIYDKDNNLIYKTKDISTGKDGKDYNTVTYAANGFQNYAGNNSTPAGILAISGISDYHGAPAFQRSRYNKETGKWSGDDVASSMHIGNTSKAKSSNGCIRIGKKSLEDMSKYLGVGDMIYTLPENEGSRFVLKSGKLNFVADNPYGVTEKGHMSASGHDMINWDDYNVHVDKSYSPLVIKQHKVTGNQVHDKNALDYANTLSTNKETLQKRFNLSSNEYNSLAQLAMGIAEQETKYGTSRRYSLKNKLGDAGIDILQYFRGNGNQANSKGLTQIKYDADMLSKDVYDNNGKLIQKGLSSYYNELGITKQSLETAQGAAVATLARLAYIYNTEVKGHKFTGKNKNAINPYDALLYKYQGHHEELSNHTATPKDNNYIRNVKRYLDNFDYFEERKYRK